MKVASVWSPSRRTSQAQEKESQERLCHGVFLTAFLVLSQRIQLSEDEKQSNKWGSTR
jgi:hypothetical protein